MTFERELKDEIKEELLDEEMLPQEECENTDDITSVNNMGDECLYNVMGELSIRKQDAATVKEELAVGIPTPTQQHFDWALPLQKYSLGWLSSIGTAQSTPAPQLAQSLSLKHSISKRRVEWYGKRIAPPRKFVIGWCDSRRAKDVLDFLESFAGISRGSKYSRCANFSTACNGPRILICEECLSQFGGLHDRYLKICRHYKTCHSRNCNKLIGRKLSQHHSTLLLMISAWQQDTYQTMNHSIN